MLAAPRARRPVGLIYIEKVRKCKRDILVMYYCITSCLKLSSLKQYMMILQLLWVRNWV